MAAAMQMAFPPQRQVSQPKIPQETEIQAETSGGMQGEWENRGPDSRDTIALSQTARRREIC